MEQKTSSSVLNKQDIMDIMPHRGSMLLVDGGSVLEDGSAKGFYTVRGDEFFLDGHFPDNPVVPGVIVCEMMAQSCGILFKGHSGKLPMLTTLSSVKFRAPVKAGNTVETVCSIIKNRSMFWFCKGEAFVDGRRVASAEFSFALVPEKDMKG